MAPQPTLASCGHSIPPEHILFVTTGLCETAANPLRAKSFTTLPSPPQSPSSSSSSDPIAITQSNLCPACTHREIALNKLNSLHSARVASLVERQESEKARLLAEVTNTANRIRADAARAERMRRRESYEGTKTRLGRRGQELLDRQKRERTDLEKWLEGGMERIQERWRQEVRK